MSDKATLGAIPRSIVVAITASPQNMATLIAANLNIDRRDIFYLAVCEAATGSYTFQYSADGTSGFDFAGADYSTKQAECSHNCEFMWITGSGAINVNCIVYVKAVAD